MMILLVIIFMEKWAEFPRRYQMLVTQQNLNHDDDDDDDDDDQNPLGNISRK